MNNKIVKISFNIWANNDAEGEELKKCIYAFIDCLGEMGIKVSASKLSKAISKWQNNVFIKNNVINYFNE